jgi:hypothetical protein
VAAPWVTTMMPVEWSQVMPQVAAATERRAKARSEVLDRKLWLAVRKCRLCFSRGWLLAKVGGRAFLFFLPGFSGLYLVGPVEGPAPHAPKPAPSAPCVYIHSSTLAHSGGQSARRPLLVKAFSYFEVYCVLGAV